MVDALLDGGWGRAAAIRRAGSAHPEGVSQDPALVDALAREFAVRPWPDVAGRPAALEREHGPRVRSAR
ncbi:hypothetical protein [Pseudonocardia humida]|uniref:Uncharacterized protein n=1 Tax=Pseudonocardia humida TaxID=2800819 RepID=A0ABT1A5L0_9PSEU|nr:hypothetical protein [Pseudonocardia humida]MCO1658203.1 hypothetical protein [Pseudonocardia humida]